MLEFKRDGSTIEVKVNTSIGWHYTQTIRCSDEPYAILLTQNLNDHLRSELTRIRREAYEQGWKDKSRKQRKETWWKGTWR